jgi:catechol 2,3-dioxygenase-like lactoylglutathione lyase family enzyme
MSQPHDIDIDIDGGPSWPAHLRVQQVRVARPTDRLEDVVAFYVDGLGLTRLGDFEGHAGYDGVFVGLPGTPYHLEFTHHVAGSPGDVPSAENLLVLYLESVDAVQAVVRRLRALGHEPVEAENPYWDGIGAVTIPDPDGWRVVLAPTRSLTHEAGSGRTAGG